MRRGSALAVVSLVACSGAVPLASADPIGDPTWEAYLDAHVPDVDPAGLPKFSFFITSLAALQALSGSETGFGGDFRFGQTGAGAGLRGADRICATIAERSLAGASKKTWRAFLSATDDGTGAQVDAIDRIGAGPWYDRTARLVASAKAGLLAERPAGADAAIRNDLPNEDGVPNHTPDPAAGEVDNHHMLTGSDASGRLYSADATCLDWTGHTGASGEGRPRVGMSWPHEGGRMANWLSQMDEAGCAPGMNLVDTGGVQSSANDVGSGGGYGGFYCFALMP